MHEKFYPVRQTIWAASAGQIISKGVMGDGGQLFSQSAIDAFRDRVAKGLCAARSDFEGYGLDAA